MLNQNLSQKIYQITLLILAGESIFILPFVLARIFRPTFLAVFELNNLQLGICFSIYGVVALVSYLYGGAIADKYAPNELMAIALVATGLGGAYMATFPSFTMMKILFGYWGFTTIFLFWGAMIKATRVWGGVQNQTRAFGLLEGGRGLVAASIGAAGVYIFALFIPDQLSAASLVDRRAAFRYVILFSSFMVVFIGVLVYFFIQKDHTANKTTHSPLQNFRTVIQTRSVWLLMMIVLCAYVGYKLTDIFSLYAAEIMSLSEVDAAKVGAFQLYLRPIACVATGFLAHRACSSTWMTIGFLLMLGGALLFATGLIQSVGLIIFILSLTVTATGTYAVRALYFAVMQEGQIPLAVTGTAVGVISVVGYTPDIFVGPIMGYLLDASPGIVGHQHVFIMLAISACAGLMASVKFHHITRA